MGDVPMILNKVYLNRVYLEDELNLLENLILLLKSNVESFNAASSKLYEVLIDIHSFLLDLYPNVLLRKRHLLQPSFQAILRHSIPIVCSCYLEHTQVDISTQLSCVVELTEHIMSEAQQIKLNYFPRTDDLGFLEFFWGYLEELMKNQQIQRNEEIEALHFEVHSLLSSAKVKNEELNETPWTDIINMTYQAEYIIDLYLSNSGDLRLMSSLSKIIEKFRNIRTDMHGLCCKRLSAQDVALTSKPQCLGATTQVGDIDATVGLQEEARSIKEYLLMGENTLDVISIVGMAGIGKTTLASIVYKSPSVADNFDILSWCSVSQRYENRDLLLAILDQVNSFDKNHRSKLDDQELADQLCKSLKKRRYLIVLDDIWDTTLWDYLIRYLPNDGKGSRVLITTRNKDVANQIGSKVNELHGLSEENSFQLFQKRMLKKQSLPVELLKISQGIVEHCKGLPLSIVIIAGILSAMERTEKKWNLIAESVSSHILSDPPGQCKAILELSYNQLPNHLRSCFLYLGLFPEDQDISVKRLINLWTVEGLVRDATSDSAEEVSRKYMDELIAKNLVIPVKERSRGGIWIKTFRLHDLLRDFCLDKAKEKHFFTLLDKKNCSQPLQDPRRLILIAPHISDQHFSYHSIRSIICFHTLNVSEIEKGIESCDMVLLRVLDVFGVWSNLFPNLSTLVHLRYLSLGLDYLEISTLPSSISELQNLQILILRCRIISGIEVPDSIWDMVKLMHVHISPKASFQIDRNRFQNSSPFFLENLRSLSRARVSRGDSKWLSRLSGLQRLCCVFVDDDREEDDDLVNDDVEDNQFRLVSFNDHLTSLKVENSSSLNHRFVSTCQLPISLQELTLSEFFLTSNDISEIGRALSHLEVLKIYCCYLPSGCEWSVDEEDFPELKVLKLRNLEISNWSASENSFPNLEQLWVEECNYLDEIPLDFGYLLKLRHIFVRECAPSVDASARKIGEIQHEEQNTGMRVRIYPKK